MKAKEPSGSAIAAAMARAAHLILDMEPKILHDDLAMALIGIHDESILRSEYDAFYAQMARMTSPEYAKAFKQSYRAFAVVRHRYTEDELEKAIRRGVSQYVIMGAGLDSFAYRRRDLENKLKVFEIDHPASQEFKKARLREFNINPPGNLTFVPVDFETQTMMDELGTHGYRKDIPAFFNWLGVTPYLTEVAVFKTLHDVASTISGSEIVFEYVLPESLLDGDARQTVAAGSKRPTEPWLSTFAPDDLVERLLKIGFTNIIDFGPEEAKKAYLSEREDELSSSGLDMLSFSMFSLAHLMKARVS